MPGGATSSAAGAFESKSGLFIFRIELQRVFPVANCAVYIIPVNPQTHAVKRSAILFPRIPNRLLQEVSPDAMDSPSTRNFSA